MELLVSIICTIVVLAIGGFGIFAFGAIAVKECKDKGASSVKRK